MLVTAIIKMSFGTGTGHCRGTFAAEDPARKQISQDKAESAIRVFGSLKTAYVYIFSNLKRLAEIEHE